MRKVLHSQGYRATSRALTLVEVMVAIAMLVVVVWGTMALAVQGRIGVERAGQQRAAAQVAHERIERLRAGGYNAAASSAAAVVTTVDGTAYSTTWVVTAVLADSLDANSTYKRVDVTVTWPTQARPVVLRTAISR